MKEPARAAPASRTERHPFLRSKHQVRGSASARHSDATDAAAPAIRALLRALRSQLELEGDLSAAVQGILDDDSRLEAATAALIRFIDQTVCRNYRFFATRVFRARQLTDWMRGELSKPGGGALWRFLEHANRERRYGVVVVVDGLQGRLVEALAAGRGDHPFLRTIEAERVAAGGVRSEAVIRRRGDRLHYSLQGADLLDTDRLTPYETLSDADRDEHAHLREGCLVAAVETPESWCRETEWRQLTSYTPRPDSVAQLAHLYDTDRAGTVNLFPRSGVGYNSKVPGRHAGESFHEKNALAALWGKGLARGSARPLPRSAPNGAIPMAVFEFLSGERPVPGSDGWGYTPLPPGLFSPRPTLSDEPPAPSPSGGK